MSVNQPTYQIQYGHLEKQWKMLAQNHQPKSNLEEKIQTNRFHSILYNIQSGAIYPEKTIQNKKMYILIVFIH